MQEWVLEKRLLALGNGAFKGCATCPGSAGKILQNGKMFCSNVPPEGAEITGEQALKCEYGVPPPPVIVGDVAPEVARKLEQWKKKYSKARNTGRRNERKISA